MRKRRTKSRAVLLGGGPNGSVARVDGIISVSDLLAVLRAFSGAEYPFAPPGSGDEGA